MPTKEYIWCNLPELIPPSGRTAIRVSSFSSNQKKIEKTGIKRRLDLSNQQIGREGVLILTDNQLIREALGGHKAAFRQLVERYQGRVKAVVVGMLGDCGETEDVAQETFVRFYRSLDKFREEAGLGTYLTRIAINLSLNELKKRKRRSLFFFTKDPECMDRVPDPGHNACDWDEKEVVRKAISELKPEYRAVVVLRIMNDMTTGETAAALGVPLGTVLSRLSRAQKILKKNLEKSLGVGDEKRAVESVVPVV